MSSTATLDPPETTDPRVVDGICGQQIDLASEPFICIKLPHDDPKTAPWYIRNGPHDPADCHAFIHLYLEDW